MSTLRASIAFSIVAALTACGGGGGGAGTSDPPANFAVSGSVTGLAGTGLTVRANSTNVAISANGTVALLSGVTSGTAYNVTVISQPTAPAQVCTVANASGTVSGSNVTNIEVACTTTPLSLSISTPIAGSADAQRTVSPVLTFSAPLDAGTAIAGNVSLQSAAGTQPITLNASGRDLTVTPTRRLLPLASYTLTVGTGLRGSHGEALTGAISVTFTTVDGQWQASEPIPGVTGQATNTQIAFDAGGAAIAVWEEFDGTSVNIDSNRYTPGSGWGVPEHIETATDGAIDPQIVIDASGNALSVWTQFNGNRNEVAANRYTAGSGWGSAELIEAEDGNTFAPQIAIDSTGNALAVWTQNVGGVGIITSNRFTPGSGWSGSRLIASDNSGISVEPQVAFDTSGNALLIWAQGDGNRFNITANRAPPGGAWGVPVLLENSTGEVGVPQIAIDADGNALAVWPQNDGANFSIWSSRYTVAGGWGTPMLIETDDAGNADNVQIAIDASGNALAIWQQHDGQRRQIWSNRYTTASGWGTAARIVIGAAGGSSSFPQIAIDPSGNALAVWHETDGMDAFVLASRYVVGDGWRAGTQISPNEIDILEPQIATDADGNALAVWTTKSSLPSGDDSFKLWFSRFE
jgi:hypothetical protein